MALDCNSNGAYSSKGRRSHRPFETPPIANAVRLLLDCAERV